MKIQHSAPARSPSGFGLAQPSSADHSGFPKGTVLLTQRGEMPIERISTGDKVITRNSGFASVLHVAEQTVETHFVRVKAGSLGHTRPEEDIDLPAAQHVLVRDWRAQAMFGQSQAFAPVGSLVDGEFVLDLGPVSVDLITIGFARPQVIYAGGLEACVYPDPIILRQAA